MSTLVRPLPLPEELDSGYLGRVMRFNGFRTEGETFDGIARMLGSEKRLGRERPRIELLSLIAGQSLEQFTQQHSMIPFFRGIARSYVGVPHGSSTLRFILHNRGIGAERRGANFCAKCVSDDIWFHGISYWRRDHQIPGQLWCPKHSMPLNCANASAFLQAPSNSLDYAKPIHKGRADAAMKHTLVNRAMDIASGLLARRAPLESAQVAVTLRKQALDMGYQTRRGGRGFRRLVDQICDSFPNHWLKTIFPGGVEDERCKALYLGDAEQFLWKPAPSVWPYILASAVLFKSADEALNKLAGFAEGAVRPIPPTSMQQAISEFTELGLPNQAVAHCGTKNLLDALEAFYLQGKSISDSAAIGGVSLPEMEDLLRKIAGNLKSALIATRVQKRTSEMN